MLTAIDKRDAPAGAKLDDDLRRLSIACAKAIGSSNPGLMRRASSSPAKTWEIRAVPLRLAGAMSVSIRLIESMHWQRTFAPY